MLSILKKEIAQFFNSLSAYLSIGLFLTVTGLLLWVFPESSLLEYGYASLEGLFNLSPYLLLFLVPAITMRSISEEKKEGTYEHLATAPISRLDIILGKYLACLFITLCAIAPTLIYYFSIYQLGNPIGNVDTGAVIGSYIGLTLIACSFTAIGLFASASTSNQMIAFLLAVFLCFIAFSGFDSISKLTVLQPIENIVSSIGINEHYQAISRGVLDTKDFIYFLSVSSLFLLLTNQKLASNH